MEILFFGFVIIPAALFYCSSRLYVKYYWFGVYSRSFRDFSVVPMLLGFVALAFMTSVMEISLFSYAIAFLLLLNFSYLFVKIRKHKKLKMKKSSSDEDHENAIKNYVNWGILSTIIICASYLKYFI